MGKFKKLKRRHRRAIAGAMGIALAAVRDKSDMRGLSKSGRKSAASQRKELTDAWLAILGRDLYFDGNQ